MSKHHDWLRKYYNQLKGYTIVGFRLEIDEETSYSLPNEWPVFTLKNRHGSIIEITVSKDEEGNGAGFLFLSEVEQ